MTTRSTRMARFAEPPVKASRPGRSQPASRKSAQGLLQHLTNCQLWGERRRQPPLASRRYLLSQLVPEDLLRNGTVFLGFLEGGQWLLSYVAEPDRIGELPPMCSYRLQWWYFIPGRPLRLMRDTLLFGGHPLETQLMLSVTQWPCDPTCILVAGCSRLDEELWHVTLVSMPGVKGGEVLHACYQCSSGSGNPRLLGKGHLLLPIGQELVLLKTHQNQSLAKSICCPSDGWSSTGLQRQAELGSALLFLSVVPPPQHATVLDLELLAETLAKELCAEHNLAYEGLLDYDACTVEGASDGAQATVLLNFLLEASSRPVLPGYAGRLKDAYYRSTVLLQWDLETGLHRVASKGVLNEPSGNFPTRFPRKSRREMRKDWLPSSWSPPVGAQCWMTNDPVWRGQPLTILQSGPWSIALFENPRKAW